MKNLGEKKPEMEKWEKNNDQGLVVFLILHFPPPPPFIKKSFTPPGYSAKYTPQFCKEEESY